MPSTKDFAYFETKIAYFESQTPLTDQKITIIQHKITEIQHPLNRKRTGSLCAISPRCAVNRCLNRHIAQRSSTSEAAKPSA